MHGYISLHVQAVDRDDCTVTVGGCGVGVKEYPCGACPRFLEATPMRLVNGILQ